VSDRRFRLFWLGQTLSGFGDAFALVALPLLALEATGSVSTMGLISASGVLAQVVTSLASGTLVDRADRRQLMIACDVGRAAVYGLVPLWWALVGPSSPLLYAVAIVGGALGNTFSVAHMTAIPALVPTERLHSANAQLQGSFALSYVVGTMSAGAVAAGTGPAWALLVDAATFLASVATLAAIHFDRPPGAAPSAQGGPPASSTSTSGTTPPNPRNARRRGEPRFGAGARFVARHPLIRALTVLMVVLGLTSNIGIGAGVTDLVIFHLKHELSLGSRVVGACMGTAALGAVLGAASAPATARRIGPGPCLLAGTLVQAFGLVTIGAIPSAGAAAAGGFLWGAGMMMRGIPIQSLRQSLVPHELLGRVTAVSWVLGFGASAVGAAVVTRAASSAGASATLRAIGVLVGLVAMAASLSPAVRRARHPSGANS
jgi:hypothetical protein